MCMFYQLFNVYTELPYHAFTVFPYCFLVEILRQNSLYGIKSAFYGVHFEICGVQFRECDVCSMHYGYLFVVNMKFETSPHIIHANRDISILLCRHKTILNHSKLSTQHWNLMVVWRFSKYIMHTVFFQNKAHALIMAHPFLSHWRKCVTIVTQE